MMVARINERTSLHAGDRVGVDVVADEAHWFDAQGRVVRARD
jgi:multiple sugar transport system ATP-binding protein